ncbi:MAG: gliding motility-associated C-terminal domain-containing protein [Agriterribacter sp.]
MRILYWLLLSGLLSQPVTSQVLSSSALYSKSTPQNGFLKNIGQVKDLNNKPVDYVLYQANISGQQVFVTQYGLSVLFATPKNVKKKPLDTRLRTGGNMIPADSLSIITYELERIDIVLKNASVLRDNILTKTKQNSPLFNLYLDSSSLINNAVELQEEILIKNVYPGIDWKIYIKDDEINPALLKYDFIVHPGADPARIALKYSNNAKISLFNNEISGRTKTGIISEKNPYSYLKENNNEVAVEYALKKNLLHFNVSAYDHNQTLIIDPSIFWLTYLTTTDQLNFLSLEAKDVETDAAGNIFLQLSASTGAPFPTKNPGGGAYYQEFTSISNGSMIISKFAPGGQLLWSTYFGNCTAANVMTIDNIGNIIAVGMQKDGNVNDPIENPFVPLLNNGGYYDEIIKKHFIAKFSNAGILLWSSYYADFSTFPTDMSFDTNGNIYVTGNSEVYGFPTTDPGGGAYFTTPQQATSDVLFISQFDASCNLVWSTRLQGDSWDFNARVCTDKLGNIYMGGRVRSTNYPLVDAGGYLNDTAYASVVTRFNAARKMTWSTRIPAMFTFSDITVDDSSNVYIVADWKIIKFDAATNMVFNTKVNTSRMHFWQKINYDPHYDHFQLLGVMNDFYSGFPTLNTACEGSFFYDGSAQRYPNATGPIFATMEHNGIFSYLSLVDWVAEYYDYNEMSVDINGDVIYVFGNQLNGYSSKNPQLTDPGDGAYYDDFCCYVSNGKSSLLLKLKSSELLVTTPVITPSGCNCDGTAEVTLQCGKAPFTYEWSTGASTASVSGLCPGNYWVKVTDANNLSKKVIVTVPNPPGSISAVTSEIIPENCNKSNGIIRISDVQGGTAPYSYSLNGTDYNSSQQFNRLDSGNYIIYIKDANGCIFNDTSYVTRITAPVDAVHNIRESGCIGNTGELHIESVQGGVAPYQYTLTGIGNNNTGDFTALSPAVYELVVTDAAGCAMLKSVIIPQALGPTNIVFNNSKDHCEQGLGFIQIMNIAGGKAPYAFSVDSITFVGGIIDSLKAGNYNLFVKDANGCVLKKEDVVIENIEGITSADLTLKQAYCGETKGIVIINAVAGGSSPYSYSTDSTNFVASSVLSNIEPGIHNLYIRDAFNCVYKKDVQIKYAPATQIHISPSDTTVCYYETVPLMLVGDIDKAESIQWSVPAQSLSSVVKANSNQQVYVSIIDNNNCLIIDTSIIQVKACSMPEKCVNIPSAFTPNNDGKNETIGPLVNGCHIESLSFKIYNRFGELIFETKEIGTKWDGTYKNIPQPSGTFAFFCSYVTEDGALRQQTGYITLIR